MKRSRVRVNLLVILTILMCFPCTSIGDTDISLYPIHVNGTWGFINEQGVIVIPPQYVDVLPFSGMFTGSSCDGKNWGIIDADGRFVLPPNHEIVWGNNCNICAVYVNNPDDAALRCGLFNLQSGKFSGFQWHNAILCENTNLYPVQSSNGLWGYASMNSCMEVIPCQFSEASSFHEGWACVRFCNQSNEIQDPYYFDALANETGNFLYPPTGFYIYGHDGVSNGLIQIIDMDTGLTGYMDMNGQLVIEAEWMYGSKFYGNFAWVMDNETEERFYIDRTGNALDKSIRPIGTVLDNYDACEFYNGVSCVAVGNNEIDHVAVMTEKGNLLYVLEETTTSLIFPYYDYEEAWYMDYQGRYGLIDREGCYLTDANFYCVEETGSPFINGLAAVREYGIGGKWGFIDRHGEWIIAPEWDDADSFVGKLAYVEKHGKMAYINQQGTVIWEEE